ncbi:hypothetical protein [Prevotella aurantiaca]
MSEAIEKALDLIDTFEIRRAREIDESVLSSMTGPIIDDEEHKHIIECFNSKHHLIDDRKGHLASFVVIPPMNIPLVFFSLRCGELFQVAQPEIMKIGFDAAIALEKLRRKEYVFEEDRKELIEVVGVAVGKGMTINDIMQYSDKKISWNEDEKLEKTKEITKVLISYPAVELKLFGINESAKEYWKSLGFPKDIKMGETLFWLKVVDTLEEMHKYVGCQFVYLFAADKEAEGQLVQYYKMRLGFKSDASLSANKPRFDWQSQFLFQSTDELFDGRDRFKTRLINGFKEDGQEE